MSEVELVRELIEELRALRYEVHMLRMELKKLRGEAEEMKPENNISDSPDSLRRVERAAEMEVEDIDLELESDEEGRWSLL
ncbi:hypothetical protein [Methanopyrus sp.]